LPLVIRFGSRPSQVSEPHSPAANASVNEGHEHALLRLHRTQPDVAAPVDRLFVIGRGSGLASAMTHQPRSRRSPGTPQIGIQLVLKRTGSRQRSRGFRLARFILRPQRFELLVFQLALLLHLHLLLRMHPGKLFLLDLSLLLVLLQ
jgi:hypothetical protein